LYFKGGPTNNKYALNPYEIAQTAVFDCEISQHIRNDACGLFDYKPVIKQTK
jgi:hypothetical protein